jgi:hypothetical protein
VGDARRAPALTVLVATMAAAAVAATGYAVDTSAGRSSVTPPPAQTETPRAPESTPAAPTTIGGPGKTVVLRWVRVKTLSGGRVALVLKSGKLVVLRPGTRLRLTDGRLVQVVKGKLVFVKASGKNKNK